MTTATAKANKAMEKEGGGSGVVKAAETAAGKLLAARAREVLAEGHSKVGRNLTMEEKTELRIKINEIMSDSEAPLLKGEETDAIPLRCKGDPFDLGSYSNLHEALVDLRNYLNNNNHLMSTDIRSETGHDTWGGYGSM